MRREIKDLDLMPEESTDKSTMPYCWAVVMETLRFLPITGFGGPHHSENEVIIDNYKIPAWTDVFPNVAGIMRNSSYWENPHDFNPDRFLDDPNPKHWIPFQIGNRSCPGRTLALEWMFTISIKLVSEFKLTFDGFEDTTLNNPSALEEINFIGT